MKKSKKRKSSFKIKTSNVKELKSKILDNNVQRFTMVQQREAGCTPVENHWCKTLRYPSNI